MPPNATFKFLCSRENNTFGKWQEKQTKDRLFATTIETRLITARCVDGGGAGTAITMFLAQRHPVSDIRELRVQCRKRLAQRACPRGVGAAGQRASCAWVLAKQSSEACRSKCRRP
jgi:hypothetical protein